MLPKQDGSWKVSELSPCLVFATYNVNELLKFSHFNLFKNILGYLSSLAFFLTFWYTVRLTTFVTYNDFFLWNCVWRKKIMFKHMTQSWQENYFYYKCKRTTLKNLVPKNINPSFFKKPHPNIILPHLFYNSLDPRKPIKFFSPLKNEGVQTMDLHHGKHSLCCSMLQIVQEGTQSAISQLWRTQTKCYGLD